MEITEFGLQVIAVTTGVVTAGFVVHQTHRIAKASAVRAMGDLASSLSKVNAIFVNSPEMRPYFYEGRTPQGLLTRHRVDALVELLADYLETSLYAEENLRKFREENRGDLRRWIGFLERQSPAFRAAVDSQQHEWWPRLRKAVKCIRESAINPAAKSTLGD